MEHVERWQNQRDHGARAAWLAAAPRQLVADLTRGMVVPTAAAATAELWTGLVELVGESFTQNEPVADAFARMDEVLPAGFTRVKLFLERGTAVRVHEQGDHTYDFEAEWLVLGTYTGEAEVVDDQLVVVTLTAA